jgi:hypothetical protein
MENNLLYLGIINFLIYKTKTMKKYTIETIRKYIESQDSLGDVLYNLSEEKLDELENEESDILEDEEDYLNPWSNDNEFPTDLNMI